MPMHNTILEHGLIPIGQPCPFTPHCEMKNSCGRPNCMDKNFSCGAARGFDMYPKYHPKKDDGEKHE